MTDVDWKGSNFPTWAVYRFLTEEDGLLHEVEKIVEYSSDIDEIAEELRELVAGFLPKLDGLSAELLKHAVEQVNWLEIAEAFPA